MSPYSIILNTPSLLCPIVGIIGLMVGSFLNVVIYRLPIMMQRGWKQECQEFLELPCVANNRWAYLLEIFPKGLFRLFILK
jgi:prepilin signal peptidase PulO-like enzyme (type II secretory pathway)